VTGCRWPALGPVQRHWPHQSPLDLALQLPGHPAVAQDAGHVAPLGPGRLDSGSDFRRDVAVAAEGRAQVLVFGRLQCGASDADRSIGLGAAFHAVFHFIGVDFKSMCFEPVVPCLGLPLEMLARMNCWPGTRRRRRAATMGVGAECPQEPSPCTG